MDHGSLPVVMVVDLGSWRGVICALGGTSTLYGTTERRASMTANRVDTGTVSAVHTTPGVGSSAVALS